MPGKRVQFDQDALDVLARDSMRDFQELATRPSRICYTSVAGRSTALRQSVGEIEKRPPAPSAPQKAIDISGDSKMSYYTALKIGRRLQ